MKYPEHIEKLIYQAKNIDINHSSQYWVLRATYLEKYLDPTYSQDERDNCYMLWRILYLRGYEHGAKEIINDRF